MRRKVEDGLELRLRGGRGWGGLTRDATGDFIQGHFYYFFSAPQNILFHSNEIQLYLYSIMPSSSFSSSSSFALFWEKLWQCRILPLSPHPPPLSLVRWSCCEVFFSQIWLHCCSLTRRRMPRRNQLALQRRGLIYI